MPADDFDRAFQEAADLERINNILSAHKDKNFVQRIISPEKYPSLPRPDIGPGVSSTHEMSYSTTGKGAIAYPMIVQENSGALKMLSPEMAVDHAIKTGQFVPFDNQDDADWFTKNYKKVWKQKPTGGVK